MTGAGNAALTAAALDHAARGWSVFPLRPYDKRPAVDQWEQRATVDPDRIRRCWTAGPYGIGIACGPSALVVVDLDIDKTTPTTTGPAGTPSAAAPAGRSGIDVFAELVAAAGGGPIVTYTVRTGSGGGLYFAAPDPAAGGLVLRNTAGRLGALIDTRAAGGYVVAAPTVTNAGAYTVLCDTGPAELPDWMTTALTDPDPPAPAGLGRGRVIGRPTEYAAAALRAEITAVLAAQSGGRNHALNTAAFALGQLVAAGLLPEGLVLDGLTAAGVAIGLDGREVARTLRSGFGAGARSPRPMPA